MMAELVRSFSSVLRLRLALESMLPCQGPQRAVAGSPRYSERKEGVLSTNAAQNRLDYRKRC